MVSPAKSVVVMKINVSAVLDYLECPSKWFLRYVCCRSPRGEGKAIRFGNRWHSICEHDRMSYDPRDEPHERLLLRLGRWELQRTLRHWDIEILEREITLEGFLPDSEHMLMGRLDALVRWNEQTWHLQYKTMAQSKDVHFFQRIVARSYHEHAYRHLAIVNGYTDYAGTILVGLRKLSRAAIKRGEKLITIMPIAIPYRPGAICELAAAASAMDDQQRKATSPMHTFEEYLPLVPQNPMACDGYFHGPATACPYLDICDGLAYPDSLPHVDPLDRYKETP